MQRLLIWVAGMVLLSACSQTGQKEEGGTPGNMEEVVSATVEEILAQPAEYEGKKIAISGMVTHVCRHGGQKCFVLGEDGETQIRIDIRVQGDEHPAMVELTIAGFNSATLMVPLLFMK